MKNDTEHRLTRAVNVGRCLALLALFAALHAALVVVGRMCRYDEYQLATIWPSTGFALAVLLLIRLRWWPAIWAIMFLVETIVSGADDASPKYGAILQLANIVEASLGAGLIRRYLGRRVFPWGLRTMLTIVVAGVSAAAAGGLMVAVSGAADYSAEEFRQVFFKWFLADGIGMLLTVPLVLTWFDAIRHGFCAWQPWKMIEPAICLLTTIFAAMFVFGNELLHPFSVLHHPYLIGPCFIWAALRFHPRIVASILMLVAVMLVLNAQDGRGPTFVWPEQETAVKVLSIQAYLAVACGATLILSAVVTDRKRAYAELVQSEERFRLAIEAVGEGSFDWHIDVNTNKVHYSDQWLKSLGFSRHDAPSSIEFWHKRLHPDDRQRVIRELDTHISGDTDRFESEYRLRTKSGKDRWTRGRGRVVERDAHGKPRRVVVTEDDITVRRTAQDKLAHLELKLAHVARLSTAGEVVAAIAHEVNQPIYAVVNYAKASRNLASQGAACDMDQLQDGIEQITEAAGQAGKIIKRWRSFVTRGEFQPEPTDANDLVREACQLMAFTLRKTLVRVELVLATDLPPVVVDPVHIQQVLVNLLQNACEAMAAVGNDERRITVRTRRMSPWVSISVADTGPGLPHDIQSDLFDSFYSTKPNGLGMGLAISKTIIEAHGGRLWADEAKGRGAEFLFTLPTEKPDDRHAG